MGTAAAGMRPGLPDPIYRYRRAVFVWVAPQRGDSR